MPGQFQISCPFFPTGSFGDRFFSGPPGMLTCSFSLITFAVAMFMFWLSLKWVKALADEDTLLRTRSCSDYIIDTRD